MEFRLIFDTIPEQFDQHRPRYTPELFAKLIDAAKIAPGSRVLELGPGTGQATEPVLRTGCEYCAIELGEQLCRKMQQKFGDLSNFTIIHDDFITHDFGMQQFDLVYSAATIQWIPEEVAYPKCFSLLRPGGMLAMMYMRSDYRSPNPALYDKIQQVYAAHYKPDTPYRNGNFRYDHADDYGFEKGEKYEFRTQRILTAEEYVGYCGTHCDHMTIPEPDRSLFFDGLHKAVAEAGDRIVFQDTFVLHLAKKPE